MRGVSRRSGNRKQSGRMLALLLVALPGCASHPHCGAAGCAGDIELAAAVRSRLAQYGELAPPNLVYVTARNGVVYLTGQVATDLQRRTAESAAREAAGAHRVIDSIALTYHGR